MKNKRKWLQYEVVRMPLGCLFAGICGSLLTAGTVCGTASPLAAAAAAIVHPLYGVSILLGSLLTFVLSGLQAKMYFLICALVSTVCIRILFYEHYRPHVLAFLSAFAGVLGGAAADFFFRTNRGMFPVFVLQALLLGVAVYFLADAADSIRRQHKVYLESGNRFTFAIAALLCITALSGLDLAFCNIGRVLGLALTLHAAKQYRFSGGTLCGALTVCGVVLCSVPLGMPLLFLPVTGMMAGFLSALPNALYVPVFALIQLLSAAVFDGSTELIRILLELFLAGVLYGVTCHSELFRIIAVRQKETIPSSAAEMQAGVLSGSFRALREETEAVMQRLRPLCPEEPMSIVHSSLCEGCKNENNCWKQRSAETKADLQKLLHQPELLSTPELLGSCIRRSKLADVLFRVRNTSAIAQMQRSHIFEQRASMLEMLRLLEEIADRSAPDDSTYCPDETDALQSFLRQCGLSDSRASITRLHSGRYTACISAAQDDFPISAVGEVLTDLLGVRMCAAQENSVVNDRMYYFYQEPAYRLEVSHKSVSAHHYPRCGDSFEMFFDPMGNQFLILSDGMGSGNAASLISQIAVRTFRQLVVAGLKEHTVLRFLNLLLPAETGTENFTTIDILKLHADSGTLELIKSGASSTIIRRGLQVRRLASPSFPVGIAAFTEPFCKQWSASPDDVIMLLSDGIHEAQYPFIKQLLLQNLPLDEIVEEICAKAPTFCGGTASDDLTVIAAAVRTAHIASELEAETASRALQPFEAVAG